MRLSVHAAAVKRTSQHVHINAGKNEIVDAKQAKTCVF
jgi:hypothetical protein